METPAKPPTTKGPAKWFTGDVWLDAITTAREGSTVAVNAVHFTPGARTAWHSHANGQTLYVIEGEGRIQTRGADVVTLRAGVVTYTPADEWHWHGAAPDHLMTHLSITDGPATWGDHVTDAEYHAHEHG